MDRGAWQATVQGVPIIGHNLATKPPPPPMQKLEFQTGEGRQRKESN